MPKKKAVELKGMKATEIISLEEFNKGREKYVSKSTRKLLAMLDEWNKNADKRDFFIRDHTLQGRE